MDTCLQEVGQEEVISTYDCYYFAPVTLFFFNTRKQNYFLYLTKLVKLF